MMWKVKKWGHWEGIEGGTAKAERRDKGRVPSHLTVPFLRTSPSPPASTYTERNMKSHFFPFLDKKKRCLILSSFLILVIIYSHKYKPSLLMLGLNTLLQIWKLCVINFAQHYSLLYWCSRCNDTNRSNPLPAKALLLQIKERVAKINMLLNRPHSTLIITLDW